MSAVDQSPYSPTDRGPGLVAFAAVLSFVTTVFVWARFWSRKLTRQPFGLDDWLCLAALLVHHVFMAASCVSAIQGGMGRDIRLVAAENPYSVVILHQSIAVTIVAYAFSTPLVKLSVLALYWRLFPTRTVKLGCKILAGMCITWCIGVNIQDFVECWVSFEGLRSNCLADPQSANTVGISSILNCIIDFLTLILPINEIIRLKISNKQKVKICVVFLLGGIACAASVVRTVVIANFYKGNMNNFTQQFVLAGVATLVETYVAIIGACLPILGPVYQRLRHGGKREKDTTPRVARRDGRVTHTLNDKNHRVAGHSFESLDYTFDDDSLTLRAYPGNHRVYIRSDGRNDTP